MFKKIVLIFFSFFSAKEELVNKEFYGCDKKDEEFSICIRALFNDSTIKFNVTDGDNKGLAVEKWEDIYVQYKLENDSIFIEDENGVKDTIKYYKGKRKSDSYIIFDDILLYEQR